jgi:predicted AAA+ superfamily ATPase
MIPRYYELQEYVKPGKVLVLYGPRRVGKTTLIRSYIQNTNEKYKLVSGESREVQDLLGSDDFKKLSEFIEGYAIFIVDEAQYVPNIGQGLKILVDEHPDLTVIATGSSSFDLANKI